MKNNQTYLYQFGKRLVVVSLLLLYVFSYFSFELIHQFQHSHEYEALHTEENENEACHRAVFHSEKDACDHKTHVTSLEKHCDLCDVIVQQNRLVFSIEIPEFKSVFSIKAFDYTQVLFATYRYTCQSRAPPVFA